MTKISGSGFSVNTETLRSDADTWDEQTTNIRQGREGLPSQPALIEASVGAEDVMGQALELLDTYVTYCSQGEEQFGASAVSLRKAANDYEDNEKEIF